MSIVEDEDALILIVLMILALSIILSKIIEFGFCMVHLEFSLKLGICCMQYIIRKIRE